MRKKEVCCLTRINEILIPFVLIGQLKAILQWVEFLNATLNVLSIALSHWPTSRSKKNFLTRTLHVKFLSTSNVCIDEPWTWCNFIAVLCQLRDVMWLFFVHSLLLFFRECHSSTCFEIFSVRNVATSLAQAGKILTYFDIY